MQVRTHTHTHACTLRTCEHTSLFTPSMTDGRPGRMARPNRSKNSPHLLGSYVFVCVLYDRVLLMCNVFGGEATALVGTAGQSESEDDRRIHPPHSAKATTHSIVTVSSRTLEHIQHIFYVHADMLRQSRSPLSCSRSVLALTVHRCRRRQIAPRSHRLGRFTGAFPHLTLPPL